MIDDDRVVIDHDANTVRINGKPAYIWEHTINGSVETFSLVDTTEDKAVSIELYHNYHAAVLLWHHNGNAVDKATYAHWAELDLSQVLEALETQLH